MWYCSCRTVSSFDSPKYWSTAAGYGEGWGLKHITYEERMRELGFSQKKTH